MICKGIGSYNPAFLNLVPSRRQDDSYCEMHHQPKRHPIGKASVPQCLLIQTNLIICKQDRPFCHLLEATLLSSVRITPMIHIKTLSVSTQFTSSPPNLRRFFFFLSFSVRASPPQTSSNSTCPVLSVFKNFQIHFASCPVNSIDEAINSHP